MVKELLDKSVNSRPTFGAHGPFWRSLTRDQFVEYSVFGNKLLVVGQPDDSMLVKALEGSVPFGSDMDPPPSGAYLRRMPAGLAQMSENEIQFIREWIADGCPEDALGSDTSTVTPVDLASGGSLDPAVHNDYWRDFDNWAMFQVTDETRQAINNVMGIFPAWRAYVGQEKPREDWVKLVKEKRLSDAVGLLAGLQAKTIVKHYGSPVPMITLLESYESFGNNSLPDDVQRPADVRHTMNGPMMWAYWLSFAEASVELQIDTKFWLAHSRAIMVGLLNDGLFRQRYPVLGFTASDEGKSDIRSYVMSLANSDVFDAVKKRCIEAGFAGA